MRGINVLTYSYVLLMAWCAHHMDCLLMDGPDAPSTATRLGALERALAEERQLRLNLSAELNSEKQLRVNLSAELNSEKQLRAQLDQRLLQVEAQGSHTGYPAFMATLTSSIDHCTEDQPVIFRDVKLNVADAYDCHHGVFTAPIAGTYIFTSTLTPILNKGYNVQLVKNDEQNRISYQFASHMDIYFQNSITVAVHMDVDDEVWMLCNAGDSRIQGSWHSHMAGFLISPDP